MERIGLMAFLATAYGPPWDAMEGSGVTSTGVNLRAGRQLPVIAVDPSLIPYGSIVRVSNSPFGRNKLFVAADTGGAIKGQHIDFFVASGRQAQNGWGSRQIGLQVVQRGSGPGSVTSALRKVTSGQGGYSTGPTGSMPVQQGQGPPTSFQSPVLDQAGFQNAQRRYLTGNYLSQTAKSNPWGTTGGSSGLGSLFAAGALTTTPPNVQDFQHSQTFKLAHNALQSVAGNTGLNVHPTALSGGKYVNPIPHATIGRTDQGVDINMPVGAPIRAIGDSKLVQIQQNWYSGQPLYLYQLLSGPKKGSYYYVAEQFQGVGRPGQVFHAGETIGRYARSGTGIEIGWGSPTSGGRTLAQQQGNTGDASHGNSPAGINFRRFLSSLGI